MTREIVVHQPQAIAEPNQGGIVSRLRKKLGLREKVRIPDELHLPAEEIKWRAETAYAMLQEGQDMTVKLGKNRYARFFLNEKSDAMEIRIGNEVEIKGRRFYEVKGLESMVQVRFDLKGELFTAALANFAKQDEAMMGGMEYNSHGTVYALGMEYNRSIDAVGFDLSSPTIPLNDTVRDNLIEAIFRPVQGVLWHVTQDSSPRRHDRNINFVNNVHMVHQDSNLKG